MEPYLFCLCETAFLLIRMKMYQYLRVSHRPKTLSQASVAMETSQPEFTCSKLTIETLEQGVKFFQK